MSVILGEAKDLLFSQLKNKADSSLPLVAQNDTLNTHSRVPGYYALLTGAGVPATRAFTRSGVEAPSN
jgi:hypothetical protein